MTSHSIAPHFKEALIKQLNYFDDNITDILRTLPNYVERNQLHELIREYRYRIERYLEGISIEGPDHLAWIGSTVHVRFDFDGTEESYSIALPHEVNLDEGQISFLSPMGQRLLLARVGTNVEIDSPSGKYGITVTKLSYIL
jgi:transcription elongation factor GreA